MSLVLLPLYGKGVSKRWADSANLKGKDIFKASNTKEIFPVATTWSGSAPFIWRSDKGCLFFPFPLLWQMPDGNWHRIISLGCLCWPCQAPLLLRAHSWGPGDTLPALRHPKLIHLSLLRVVKRFMVLGGCDTAQSWGRRGGNNPSYKCMFKDVLLWKHQTKLGKNWSSFSPLSWVDAGL